MLKYSFPSTFIIPCSVFCGSLFTETCIVEKKGEFIDDCMEELSGSEPGPLPERSA